MSDQPGTLETIARHLALAVQPLRDAVADLTAFKRLMYRMGWNVQSLPPAYAALATLADDASTALAAIETSSGAAQLARVLDLLEKVRALYQAIKTLADAPAGVDASAFLAEVPERLFELLLVDYLAATLLPFHDALVTLGIIEPQVNAAAAGRPPNLRTRLNFERVRDLISDPLSIPRLVYGWGDNSLDTVKLFGHLREVLGHTGALVSFGWAPTDLAEAYMGAGAPRNSLKLTAYQTTIADTPVELAFVLLPLPPEGDHKAGLILQPVVPDLGTDRQIGDSLHLKIRPNTDLSALFGIVIRPDGLSVRYPFAPGTGFPQVGFGIALDYRPDTAAVLLGDPSATRLAMQGATASMDLDLHQDDLELKASLALNGLSVVVAAQDQDGFLHTLIGGQNATIAIPLTIRWSSRDGLSFAGGAGFTLSQSANLSLGPVAVQELRLALRTGADSTRPPDLIVETGVSLSASIGPVAVAVSNVGLHLTVTFQDGNAGPFDISVGFMPPDGVGLVVDAAGVTGGGFLSHDDAKHEYSGVLQLQYVDLALQAFGLITTQVAGAAGYSLLALVDAEFPPVQLGWGFTLDGVGGLLAVHRTASTDALHAALKAGQLSSILFPKSAITNAPVILGQLDALFPTAPGRFLFGPMALIGWGTPNVLKASIAVVIELPEPVRVILLARIEARLPDASNALVRINMDALGVLDLGQDELSFDAVLFDSKLVDFTLSGAMALRATWATQREFLLAIGGVHPRFTPPAGFPALQRVTIDMPSGIVTKLRLAAYLALTSNSIQIGANLDVLIGVSGFGISGHLGFDALLQRHPFRFDADISGAVAITAGGDDLASVELDATLSGPKPYHIAGKFKVHVVFFDAGVSFDHSWGGDAPSLPEPSIDVGGLLRAALAELDGWDALLPDGLSPLVSVRRVEDAGSVLAHPLARPQVHERIAPLGLQITRYGEAIPSGDTTFAITALRIGGGVVKSEAIQDDFAPAQFFELTDEEKLERPSFERHDAGVRVIVSPVTSGGPRAKTAAYETFFVDTPGGPPREDTGIPTTPPSRDDLPTLLRFGAAGRAATRSSARRYQVPGNPIRVAEPAFVLTDKATLSVAGIGPAAGATFSDMHALLAGNRALQIVATHEIRVN